MFKLDNIKYNFGDKVIFENLTLEFEKGKAYGIVGANGVGKTTLFRLLSNQYKSRTGTITIDKAPRKIQEVGFLPTDPYFYPYMNGREYLNIVIDEEDKHIKAYELAGHLNLNLDQLVDSYSTGMKKKLAFIAHYSLDKKVIIYDEPFNGVDLESNEILMQLITKGKDQKVTLLSSHILAMLNDICDEILLIEEGFRITKYLPSNYNELKLHIRSKINM